MAFNNRNRSLLSLVHHTDGTCSTYSICPEISSGPSTPASPAHPCG